MPHGAARRQNRRDGMGFSSTRAAGFLRWNSARTEWDRGAILAERVMIFSDRKRRVFPESSGLFMRPRPKPFRYAIWAGTPPTRQAGLIPFAAQRRRWARSARTRMAYGPARRRRGTIMIGS